MASPSKLVLYYHCLDTSCVGLNEDTDIGAAMFPSDIRYLSETTLVEFLQGLLITSIFPEVVIIGHSISQFP